MKSTGDDSIVDTGHDHAPPANVRHPHLNGVVIERPTLILLYCNGLSAEFISRRHHRGRGRRGHRVHGHWGERDDGAEWCQDR
jgi:hypothetical protein